MPDPYIADCLSQFASLHPRYSIVDCRPKNPGRFEMKYGARNQLIGKVTEIKKGTVMCQVRLEVAAGATMNSVMTLESLDDLGIKVGDNVKVVVKAVNVLLVRE
jgi:molybdopterin-binding protein